MHCWTFVANDEQATDRLGAALARAVPGGYTIALYGTLGSGKTRLVQAIAAACGVPRESVVSPTFVLCQQYEGSVLIYHLDAYRLRDEDDFWDLGVEELFASSALVVIEWADRVAGCLPPQRLDIRILVTGDTRRTFELSVPESGDPTVIDAVARSI